MPSPRPLWEKLQVEPQLQAPDRQHKVGEEGRASLHPLSPEAGRGCSSKHQLLHKTTITRQEVLETLQFLPHFLSMKLQEGANESLFSTRSTLVPTFYLACSKSSLSVTSFPSHHSNRISPFCHLTTLLLSFPLPTTSSCKSSYLFFCAIPPSTTQLGRVRTPAPLSPSSRRNV